MRKSVLSRFLFALLLSVVSLGGLRAQQNWRFVNPLPAGEGLAAVAYGAGVYVAVGTNSIIVSSPDAATWTVRRQSISSHVLNNVIFANGQFMAVGQDATSPNAALVLTSPDGITWTQRAVGYAAQLFEVIYGDGVWMVSGLSSPPATATSTDNGATWTVRGVTGGDGAIRGAHGNSRFVFLNDQNRVNVSTDNGATWTRSFIVGTADNFNVGFQDILFANGKFYAAGREAGFNASVYSSTDGLTWTAEAATVTNSSGGATFLAHENGVFVMGGNGGLFTSANGATWTKQTSALPLSGNFTEGMSGVGAANGNLFCLGIYGSITSASAASPATWTRRSTGTVHSLEGLVHDGTRFVATGARGAVVTSTDGTMWTEVSSGQTSAFGRLAFGAGRYVTAGLNGGFSSANLTSWTAISGTTFNQMFGVIYANNQFIVANNALALGIKTSADGVTWANATVSGTAFQEVKGLAGGGGTFVIATSGFGVAPKIFSSADAATWADSTPASFTAPESLAYGNGRFVLLTSSHAWTSTDGVTWTATAYPSAGYVTAVRYVGGKFLARGGTLYVPIYRSSSDGVTWTDIENSSGTSQAPGAIEAHGSVVIAVGGGGMILRGDLEGATPSTTTTLSATVASGATVQWQRNGANLAGETGASLTLDDVAPGDTGIYTANVTASGTTTAQPFIVGVSTTGKLVGTGEEFPDNVHPNGNIYDQILLESAAASFTADAGQVTRLSFVDMNDDIVQVEFAGAGTVSIVLEGATTRAVATKYNQPEVKYLKGHAGIVITGANETTNLVVFSVGKVTAVNQALFPAGVTYDGYADLAFVAIASGNGKFGTMRSGNSSFWNTKGFTGVYAPGVTFQGAVFIHDIEARETATPVFMIGGASETRITGGDLTQSNGAAVQVSGLTELQFTAGSDSHGNLAAAKTIQARLEEDGADVTVEHVPGAAPAVTPIELTYFAAGSNPPYTMGAKKAFEVTLTRLKFDTTTLTNPTTMTLNAPMTGSRFTDSATGLTWEVYFRNDAFHEINIMRGSEFVGQWSL